MSTYDRERLTQIFDDTVQLWQSDDDLKALTSCSVCNQKVILEGNEVACPKEKFDKPAKIVVSKRRTLEAAMRYKGKQVCVHNFASFCNPGGGVERGAVAQEECICRSSTLFANLIALEAVEKFYKPHRKMHNPLGNDDCIYSPYVTIIKSDTDYPETLYRGNRMEISVITCAAPNLRAYKGRISQRELKELHEKRMRRILDIAKANGNTVVILGAFGCGVFQNQPEVVAEAYTTIIKEYRYDFEVIEFAVYCPPKDTRNYDVFKRKLKVFER